jgi:3-hydroxyacyl-CoA dehydrogenase/enoyl-CoA hydratase/3-hydroxybutyryl-CoA epimerase
MMLFEAQNLRIELRPQGIALLRIDVPGRNMNVFTRQALADLEAGLDRLQDRSDAKVLVMRGDKVSGFVAGADLQEFAQIHHADEARGISAAGQRVFQKLAALDLPTIALIHGPCLGGGLECALACDYRLLLDHPKTQLGLPEVELGLLPAWGGTQRLPHVVGLERALQVIVGGRRLSVRDALRWGLADDAGTTEKELSAKLSLMTLRAVAERRQPSKRLPLRTWRQRWVESTALGRHLVFRGAARMIQRKVPDDMPAPWEALWAVKVGLSRGMSAGLAYEQEAAARLATTSACRNLIHLFLRREEARKPAVTGTAPDIQRVAVVGAGTMGAGIAQVATLRGFDVVVREVSEPALAAGMQRIRALFDKAVENGLLSAEKARQRLASIRQTTAWDGIGEVDLVVEAVLEDLPLKRAVFQELERHTRPTTLLATNTSSLLVQQLQEGLTHPERVAGLHFFNPVHKMPLVEVVQGPASTQPTVGALAKWAATLGKIPVMVHDSPGFVVNRILMPYLAEAVLLAAEGISVATIDSIMRRFGMPMGPLELLDQVGIDVAAHIAHAMQPVFGSRPDLAHVAQTFDAMSKNGWLGQKTGLGFYRYHGKAKKLYTAALDLMPAPEEAAQKMRALPKALQMSQARERMVLLMVNEAAACLSEGLAADSATIDLAMVLGTGWAPHRGGPLAHGEERGWQKVVETLEELTGRFGERFRPCPALRSQGQVAHDRQQL